MGLCLYDTPRMGKSRETESQLVVVKDCGRGEIVGGTGQGVRSFILR